MRAVCICAGPHVCEAAAVAMQHRVHSLPKPTHWQGATCQAVAAPLRHEPRFVGQNGPSVQGADELPHFVARDAELRKMIVLRFGALEFGLQNHGPQICSRQGTMGDWRDDMLLHEHHDETTQGFETWRDDLMGDKLFATSGSGWWTMSANILRTCARLASASVCLDIGVVSFFSEAS